MIFNVHAGHNPDGKVGCGAIGLIKESTENRRVKDEVIRQLRKLGHTVYDCTVDNGIGSSDVLSKIVTKCNAHSVDYDVSIHFNAGANNKSGNGTTTGVEVLLYSNQYSALNNIANKICSEVSKLGYRNRGIKIRPELYVLRKTKAKALLVECCFVDDKDDVDLYNYKTMASAIVKGLTGQVLDETPKTTTTTTTNTTTSGVLYRVQVGAYSKKENAENMLKKLKAAGFNGIIKTDK